MSLSLSNQLENINYPAPPWVKSSLKADTAEDAHQYEVVIIGAGMAGLSAAFALKRLGIANIHIFDQSKQGLEGPWATYARMATLRSDKGLVGPAFDIPALTFKAWYESQFGTKGWRDLKKIPTLQWMEYLRWYREVLQIPVQNDHLLTAITPQKEGLSLHINNKIITTRKVILATGRAGYGGLFLPTWVDNLPSHLYAHTNHLIAFEALKGRRVGIVGAGASGFDAAATALEKGAAHVDIILRRPHLPHVNKPASLGYAGFSEGYYKLCDEKRCLFMVECYQGGVPPPVEALERVANFPHFAVKRAVTIHSCENSKDQIRLDTSKGKLSYDFLILATGFAIDGSKQPELAPFIDQILLWKDRDLPNIHLPRWFQYSPYLGDHFQFLEKIPGSAPFLKNIYCFNYAATLSHGLLSGDIPGISIGAMRLVQGIASDLFAEDWPRFYRYLQKYQTTELLEENFNFFQ